MQVETDSEIAREKNVTREITDLFVDAKKGDLHLAGPVEGITDAAKAAGLVADDIDRQPRGEQPDVGADELVRPGG